jgi:hypothetical protein
MNEAKQCSGHEPSWKTLSRRPMPEPTFFGLKTTLWTRRHCGSGMERCKLILTRRCQVCSRTETIEEEGGILAVCLKCLFFEYIPHNADEIGSSGFLNP